MIELLWFQTSFWNISWVEKAGRKYLATTRSNIFILLWQKNTQMHFHFFFCKNICGPLNTYGYVFKNNFFLFAFLFKNSLLPGFTSHYIIGTMTKLWVKDFSSLTGGVRQWLAIKEVLCWVEMSRLPSHVLTLPLVEVKKWGRPFSL